MKQVTLVVDISVIFLYQIVDKISNQSYNIVEMALKTLECQIKRRYSYVWSNAIQP
jgi:hypothetical protein